MGEQVDDRGSSFEDTLESCSSMATTHPASRLCQVAFLGVLLFAALVRLESLDRRPLHHDEGVNAHFLLRLAEEGRWEYDPANYHGPTLYYLSLPGWWIFGERELALRLLPAWIGWMGIGMLWWMRDRLGEVGVVITGMLLAISPGMVYYARDYIHETLVVTFTTGLVVGANAYWRTRRRGVFLLTVTSGALLVATKETWILTAGVWLLALPAGSIWREAWHGRRKRLMEKIGRLRREWGVTLRQGLPPLRLMLVGILLFACLFMLLYSSFLTHWGGVIDAVRAPWLWSDRSETDHVKGFGYFALLLVKLELPILLCGTLGGLWAAKSRDRFWLWVAAWTVGIFLAHSLIGYKTPWLILNLLLPLALLGGRGIEELVRWGRTARRPLLVIPIAGIFGVALLAGLWEATHLTRKLTLISYDDNDNRLGYFSNEQLPAGQANGYVYVQTDRSLLELVDLIKNEAVDRTTPIVVASPDYWPLPWYLRDYSATTYSGAVPTVSEDGTLPDGPPLLLVATNQLDSLRRLTQYRVSPTSYTLRPGIQLVLLVRDRITEEATP
jgi:uncharacterized protein (TIGR03663 family)